MDYGILEKYCSIGWRLFPCRIFEKEENGKKKLVKQPCMEGWQEAATFDLPTLKKLIEKHKATCIGVVTGKASGITVIDIDIKDGRNGFLTLENLDISLPTCPTQITPTGGHHKIFHYNPNIPNKAGVLKDVDTRNDGGFIVIEPSIFPDGKNYEWQIGQEPWSIPYGTIQKELEDLIKIKPKESPEPRQIKEKFKDGERNDMLFREASSLRAKGATDEEIISMLRVFNKTRCENPINEEELQQIKNSVIKYPEGEKKRSKRESKCLLATLVSIMEKEEGTKDLFCLNEFSGEIEYLKPPPWAPLLTPYSVVKQDDFIDLKMYVSSKYRFEPATLIFKEAVIYESKLHKYHPVRDYVKSLKWDGINRLGNWLIEAIGCEDNAYTRAIGQKTLLAAISRVFNPGCKFDYMLILEGEQGMGKSMLVSILGGDWFSEIHIGENYKELVEHMRGQWIMEVSEMVCVTKTDIAQMRAFLSRRIDRTRISYGDKSENFPRQCIFIGTLNPSGDNTYLRDDTGNRRFWPVKCTKINQGWLTANRDQLFAQAFDIYKHGGDSLYLKNDDELDIAQQHQEVRQYEDPWTPLVIDFINNPQNLRFNFIEIAAYLGIPKERIDRLVQTRLGIILRKLNVYSRRVGDKKITYYFPKGELNFYQKEDENGW